MEDVEVNGLIRKHGYRVMSHEGNRLILSKNDRELIYIIDRYCAVFDRGKKPLHGVFEGDTINILVHPTQPYLLTGIQVVDNEPLPSRIALEVNGPPMSKQLKLAIMSIYEEIYNKKQGMPLGMPTDSIVEMNLTISFDTSNEVEPVGLVVRRTTAKKKPE